jgi:cobalt-zinc-cadmium efflux system outer membrane protein
MFGSVASHGACAPLVTCYLCGFVLFFSSFFVLPVYAQNTPVLQLSDARARAMGNNPGLAMMRERYEALTHIAPQVSSLPDPVLSLNALNLPWDNLDLHQEPMTQLQLGISQTFPFPGKLALNEEIAVFEAEAAAYSVEEMRLNLDMNVTVTWWEIFYLDRAIETVLKNQAVFRQLVGVANKKYEVGEGLQQDVLLAQLELSKLLDTEIQLKAIREQRVIRLNVLMDTSPATPEKLPSSMPVFSGLLAPHAILYRRAEEARPLLQGEQSTIDASQSRLALAEKSYYPDFKVGLAYGNREKDQLGQSRQDFVSIMLSVNIPLYAGTRQSQSVKQQRRELARSRYSLLDQKNLVFSSIATAITEYQQASAQMVLYEGGIVPQARQTVESMLAGYRVNQVDFLSLAGSQTTLLNSELLYWKSFSEIHQSIARLTAAVGEDEIYE